MIFEPFFDKLKKFVLKMKASIKAKILFAPKVSQNTQSDFERRQKSEEF